MWKSKLDGLHFAKWNLFLSFLAGCGGTLFDNSGLLTSPGYPNNYPNNTHCEWTITAPSGRPLSISFSVFSINPPGDCAHNYLILYNGPDASSPPFGTYCGTVSKTNVMRFSQWFLNIGNHSIGTCKNQSCRSVVSILEAWALSGGRYVILHSPLKPIELFSFLITLLFIHMGLWNKLDKHHVTRNLEN